MAPGHGQGSNDHSRGATALLAANNLANKADAQRTKFGHLANEKWDRVLDGPSFTPFPTTMEAAKARGWLPVNTLQFIASTRGRCVSYMGEPWAPGGKITIDTSMFIYFSPMGQLSGLGVTVYRQDRSADPASPGDPLWEEFRADDNNVGWHISVGTRNQDVCTNPKLKFPEPIGTHLFVSPRRTTCPATGRARYIPLTPEQAAANGYVRGACFYGMGVHWLLDIDAPGTGDLSYDTRSLFPIIPMYDLDTGALNAIFFTYSFVQGDGPGKAGAGNAQVGWDPALFVTPGGGPGAAPMCGNTCGDTCFWDPGHGILTKHVFFTDTTQVSLARCPPDDVCTFTSGPPFNVPWQCCPSTAGKYSISSTHPLKSLPDTHANFQQMVHTYTGYGREQNTDAGVPGNALWDRVLDGPSFTPFPTTREAAEAAGWAPIETLEKIASANGRCISYMGEPYGPNGKITIDDSMILYFSPRGQLSGIGVTVYRKNLTAPMASPGSPYWEDFVADDGTPGSHISVATRDQDVCAQPALAFSETIGSQLFVNPRLLAHRPGYLNGYIPLTPEGAVGAGFVKGSCFFGMGTHYLLDTAGGDGKGDLSYDTKNLFPVIPMYDTNTGALNAIFFSYSFAQTDGPAKAGAGNAQVGWDPALFVTPGGGPGAAPMCGNNCGEKCFWTSGHGMLTKHVFLTDTTSPSTMAGCPMGQICTFTSGPPFDVPWQCCDADSGKHSPASTHPLKDLPDTLPGFMAAMAAANGR